MSSFVFNDFKKRYLNGEVPSADHWTFIPVNESFKTQFEFEDIRLDHYRSLSDFRDVSNSNKDDENTIRITRGDSLEVTISLIDEDGYPYELVDGDTVLFTVKKSAASEDILIQKEIDIQTLELKLIESDTEDLAFGTYRYEIEVALNSGDHYTAIKNAPFIITEELH